MNTQTQLPAINGILEMPIGTRTTKEVIEDIKVALRYLDSFRPEYDHNWHGIVRVYDNGTIAAYMATAGIYQNDTFEIMTENGTQTDKYHEITTLTAKAVICH
jgi:hypothetical protein